jgi:sigma-B regulation protein RsbU (phosphoserine phosphatase)
VKHSGEPGSGFPDFDVRAEMQAEIERLRVLVEASKLINSALEPRALYRSILSVASERLGVERGTLYFVDDAKKEIWAELLPEHGLDEIRLPIGRGLAGWVAETGEDIILDDAYDDPRFDTSLDSRSGFRTRSMICVPIKNRHKSVVGVLQLLNKKDAPFGPRDVEFLSSVSDHLAIAMENTMLHRSLVVKDRMERELMLGREVQARLFPPAPAAVPGVEFAAAFRPCFEVAGDYYDFVPLPSGELGLAIGDVSGKGASAAIIMSSVKAALGMAAPLTTDLPTMMARLNALLFEMARGKKHATLFFACYAPASGRLRYVNAGHLPPIVLSGDGFELLMPTGVPIGLFETASYEERALDLAPGSTLVLVTDGVTEAVDPSEDEFGHERLAEAARRALSGPLAGVPDAVLDAVDEFQAGAPPTDDETLVVMRRSGPLPV